MAMQSQGVELYWCTSTSYLPTASAKINCPTEWSGPNGAAAAIDVTCLESTARQRIMGLPDEGELSFTINYDHSDTAVQSLIDCRKNRTKRAWGVRLNDDSSQQYNGSGYCTQFQISGSVDGVVTANVVIAITGAVTYSVVA